MLGMGVVQSGIALALVLAGLIWDRLDLRRAGYAGLVAFAFSGVGVQLAKMLWRRPRPLLSVFDVRTPDGPLFTHSFPSGHTTTAFAVAIALSFFLPRFRWLPIALAFATGVSRVYLGVHYPLDVIYAAALGTLIGVVSARWMRPSRTIEPGRKDSTAESAAV